MIMLTNLRLHIIITKSINIKYLNYLEPVSTEEDVPGGVDS